MIKMLDFLFKEQTNLELVLNILSKYNMNNICNTDLVKDNFFYVGKQYSLAFRRDKSSCGLYMHGDIVPMFIFTDEDEVDILRQFIIGKYALATVS